MTPRPAHPRSHCSGSDTKSRLKCIGASRALVERHEVVAIRSAGSIPSSRAISGAVRCAMSRVTSFRASHLDLSRPDRDRRGPDRARRGGCCGPAGDRLGGLRRLVGDVDHSRMAPANRRSSVGVGLQASTTRVPDFCRPSLTFSTMPPTSKASDLIGGLFDVTKSRGPRSGDWPGRKPTSNVAGCVTKTTMRAASRAP